MKKVLFSLLLAFAFIPVTFGQSAGNAKEYSMVTKDTTICSSFTWIDGHEYSTTTTASCVKDSIVYVLHITKLEPTYDTLVAKPVEGRCFVTFNNEIYDTPGIQLVTMSAANGCDSVVKIDLSFTNHDTISVTGEACSEYPLSFGNWKDTVRATTVGESNVMIGACELHRILNITIFPAYTDSNNVSEVTAGCQYTWEGITITDTNVAHYKMLSSIHGCDSLAAVKVVSYNGIQEDTAIVNACDRYVFAPGDTLYADGFRVDVVTEGNCTYNHRKDIRIHPSYFMDTVGIVYEQLTGECKINWHNHNYTNEHDTAYFKDKSVFQCDSLTAMTVVTLTGIEHYYDTASICGNKYPASGRWHSLTFNRPTDYSLPMDTVATETSGSCAKKYHLNLSFIDNYDTVVRTSCLNYTYIFDARQPVNAFSKDTAHFTASGLHTVDENNVPLYSTKRSNQCKTFHALNLTINQPTRDTVKNDTVVRCDRYVYSYNDSTFTTIGTTDAVFTDSLYTEGNCYEEVRLLNVTINSRTYVPVTPEPQCNYYYWDVTNQNYTRTGEYTKKIGTNAKGCDSIAKLIVTINYSPEVHIEGNWNLRPGEATTLTAVNDGDVPVASYQWFIDGVSEGTDATLDIPAYSGDYNREVELIATSNNGCNTTTWITLAYNVGIDEVGNLNINIYPNPATRYINLSSTEEMKEAVVYNTVGQQVLRQSVNGNSAVLDLGNLVPGSYSLRIVSQNGDQTTRKFIVNK